MSSTRTHANQINRGLSSDKGLPDPLAPTDQTAPMTPEQQAEYLRNVVDPATGLRVDGPTIEEYVERGDTPNTYPPHSFAAKDSPGWVEEQARRVADAANATGDSQPIPEVPLADAGGSDLAPGGGTQAPTLYASGAAAEDIETADVTEAAAEAAAEEPVAPNGDEA